MALVREVSPAMLEALRQDTVEPVMFLELRFFSGNVYLTTAPYIISWRGVSWLPGVVLSMGGFSESTQLRAADVTATLSGVPVAVVALALAEPVQNRPAIIYFAAMNRVDRTIIETPTVEWRGHMDTMPSRRTGREGQQEAIVTLRMQNAMADWNRPAGGRYTDADQQMRFPGDTSLRFLAKMMENEEVI